MCKRCGCTIIRFSPHRHSLARRGYPACPRAGPAHRTTGDSDRAAEHFEDALAFARKGKYRPELAWTCCDYADLLLKRNAPGDAERAAALLDEALSLAQEMGMRPLAERVQARRKA